MEHTPPPFFKTGPSALARLIFFSALSLALLVADARYSYLATLRRVASVAVYPIQRIAIAPSVVAQRLADYFATNTALRDENAHLERAHLMDAAQLMQMKALRAENSHLRELLGERARLNTQVSAAEVLYAARDPFSRKIIIDKGSEQAVKAGEPVIDAHGVIGQVTRAYPWVSEVTLITDKNHLVPVLNARSGVRAVLAGTGDDGTLELKFVPLSADFKVGDELVTSGIDGVYPPGLPVATVTAVERASSYLFAHIVCRPLGGVNSNMQVLVVGADREQPPPPPEKAPAPRKARREVP